MSEKMKSLTTSRLNLRPFELADAPDVQRLAGDPRIAATTLNVPHPYPDGAAEKWISSHAQLFTDHQSIVYAITLKPDDQLIGCINFMAISKQHSRAEVGYWIGVDFWNNGYCTEALRALCNYGFKDLGLNKIVARHMANNMASGKVMTNVGMNKEGILKSDNYKNGKFVDAVIYGFTRDEFNRSSIP
jgi:[ribosomal protein S5]-alanine N-acetyltransferase